MGFIQGKYNTRINSNKEYKDITLIVFGKSEVLTQDNMEKFKKYHLFSSISEILEVGSIKKDIWQDIIRD